eukprot:m.359995 g.359995  ORF g.359995 m.359995 type:complete len:1154 (-) comp18850_c0_seq1:514-3975(-)
MSDATELEGVPVDVELEGSEQPTPDDVQEMDTKAEAATEDSANGTVETEVAGEGESEASQANVEGGESAIVPEAVVDGVQEGETESVGEAQEAAEKQTAKGEVSQVPGSEQSSQPTKSQAEQEDDVVQEQGDDLAREGEEAAVMKPAVEAADDSTGGEAVQVGEDEEQGIVTSDEQSQSHEIATGTDDLEQPQSHEMATGTDDLERPATHSISIGTDGDQQVDLDVRPATRSTAIGSDDPMDIDQAARQVKQVHDVHKLHKVPTNVLDIAWSFGHTASCGVQLLEDTTRSHLAFSAGHVAVIYDPSEKRQHPCLGHRSAISVQCVSADKRWLATAERGSDATLIVWDTVRHVPVRTYFTEQVGLGVEAVSFSFDSIYLLAAVTLPNGTQTIKIFDWTAPDRNDSIVDMPVETKDSIVCIAPHPRNPQFVVASSRNQIFLYHWTFEADIISATISKHQEVGDLTQSCFLPTMDRIVSGTTSGHIAVFEFTVGKQELTLSVLKAVDACHGTAIGVVLLTPDTRFLVLGCDDGCIRCYDHECKSLGWAEDLSTGAIASISFAIDANDMAQALGEEEMEVTPDTFSMAIPNFVVGTVSGFVIYTVTGSEFVSEVMFESVAGGISAITMQPNAPAFTLASKTGYLQTWLYNDGECITTKKMPHDAVPSSLVYSYDGHTLVIGCEDGRVLFLDALALEPITKDTVFDASHGTVVEVAFDSTGEYVAFRDTVGCVGLFKNAPHNLKCPWEFIGRNRSHVGGPTHIFFETDAEGGKGSVLRSIGKDGLLVEYDIGKSSFETSLLTGDVRVRLDPSCATLSIVDYQQGSEHFYLTANEEFKLKLFNRSTNMCRQTVPGPVYGAPLDSLHIVPQHEDHLGHRCLVFRTDNQIGMMLLPVDGNPNKTTAMTAHPITVSSLCISSCGKYAFTSGGEYGVVNMWQLNPVVLASQAAAASQGMDIFYDQVEGGRDGELIADLKDYFYFSQLRRQGLSSMGTREVNDRIPLSEIPDVLRAIGFFPTQHQIVDIENEIKFSEYAKTQKFVKTVSLEDIVKIFVNHRPTLGIRPEDLDVAFSAIAQNGDEEGEGVGAEAARHHGDSGLAPTGVLDLVDWLDMLKSGGEAMTEDELARCLGTLLGDSQIDTVLPERITSDIFAEEIAGFVQ